MSSVDYNIDFLKSHLETAVGDGNDDGADYDANDGAGSNDDDYGVGSKRLDHQHYDKEGVNDSTG